MLKTLAIGMLLGVAMVSPRNERTALVLGAEFSNAEADWSIGSEVDTTIGMTPRLATMTMKLEAQPSPMTHIHRMLRLSTMQIPIIRYVEVCSIRDTMSD